jgi:hypothetical protein
MLLEYCFYVGYYLAIKISQGPPQLRLGRVTFEGFRNLDFSPAG